jgi:hypothetical protein
VSCSQIGLGYTHEPCSSSGGVEDSLYDIARLHILSMKSGEAHPESTTAMVPIRGFTDFEPTIASDCVVDSFFGILLQGHEEPICELRVLNWRTGEWYFVRTANLKLHGF